MAVAQVTAAAARVGGVIAAAIPDTNRYLIELTGALSFARLNAALAQMRAEAGVISADANDVSTLESFYRDTRDGSAQLTSGRQPAITSDTAYTRIKAVEAAETIRNNASFTQPAQLSRVTVAIIARGSLTGP